MLAACLLSRSWASLVPWALGYFQVFVSRPGAGSPAAAGASAPGRCSSPRVNIPTVNGVTSREQGSPHTTSGGFSSVFGSLQVCEVKFR